MSKKLITIILALVFSSTVYGQIAEEFYGSRYNLYLMHSRIKAKNPIQTGSNSFTSLNMFDFSFGDPDKFKSYFEGNMRVINDVWWMLGKEIGGNTDYLNDGYTSSVFEFKWGLNAFSNDRLLITPGLASNSYWNVFNGHRSFTWCLGPMVKVDYLLLDKLLIRNMTGYDIPFTRSSGSLGDKSSYFTNRTEFIVKKGYFLGIDYLNTRFRSDNTAIPKSQINRVDIRLGYKIRM